MHFCPNFVILLDQSYRQYSFGCTQSEGNVLTSIKLQQANGSYAEPGVKI